MPSRRQVTAYVLCLLIFAAAVLLALRLSYPPDPISRRLPPSRTREQEDLVTDEDTLRIRHKGRYEVYRFSETKGGIAAERVEEGED